MSNNEKKMVMNNEILYILLPDYAAHEAVYLSQAISSDDIALKVKPKYVNKVVAPSLEPVKSIGSFHTLPDYSFENAQRLCRFGADWRFRVADAHCKTSHTDR